VLPTVPDRPNILFIHTDEQRADSLGCMGNDHAQTEHIDGLAADGVTFEDAHCTHPLCMPSRGTLMTGRYPTATGMWRNGIPLPEDEQTLPGLLRDAGYTTGLLGKGHLTPYSGDPDRHPESVQITNDDCTEEDVWEYWRNFDGPYYDFEHVRLAIAHGHHGTDGGHYGLWLREEHPDAVELFEPENALEQTDERFNSWKSAAPLEAHSTTYVADRTVEFIEDHAADDDPFFGWVGIPDPHFPYDPPEPYAGQTDPEAVDLPVDWQGESWREDLPELVRYFTEGEKYPPPWDEITEELVRELIAHTIDMVNLVDDGVGRILEALDANGIAEDTLVVFTSDHGDWLGDHGIFQKGAVHTDGETRIPLVVRWPGEAEDGRRVESTASLVDMMPTLLDAAGVDVPFGVQGESMVPVLTGEQDSVREYAHVVHRHEEGSVNFSPGTMHLKTIIGDDYRLSHYSGLEQPYGQLIDRQNDPGELDNLWFDETELRDELMYDLVDLMLESEDPLPEREFGV
jgi:arylsulfatase A-like enzyme